MTELDEAMVEKFKVLAAHRNESGKSWCDFMWFVDEHAEAFVDAITAILPDLREQHYAECAAGIVAWLKDQWDRGELVCGDELADAIERGDHITKEGE